MKNPRFRFLVLGLSAFALAQPIMAAGKSGSAAARDVVAALRAVSPDPLGGRLGLAVVESQPVRLSATRGDRNLAVRAEESAATPDRRAYSAWKADTKS